MTQARILAMIGAREDLLALSILCRFFLFRTFLARLLPILGTHPIDFAFYPRFFLIWAHFFPWMGVVYLGGIFLVITPVSIRRLALHSVALGGLYLVWDFLGPLDGPPFQ